MDTILNSPIKQKMMFKLFVLICLFQGIFGWWDTGHMTVANIAKIRLTQTNRLAALEEFQKLIHGFDNLTDGTTDSFVEAAVWPDVIKESSGVKQFDNYHYTGIVYDPDHIFASMNPSNVDYNSINTMKSVRSVLEVNKGGVTFERCFMARFLLHLGGDIHQPLHSIGMFNETFKYSDYGGNKVEIVTPDGLEIDLHSFLDSMAGEQKPKERIQRPLTCEGKDYLNQLSESIMSQFPPSHFTKEQLGDLDPHSWSVESYNLAVEKVYPFVFKNNILTKEYSEEIYNLCRERVALAGYRVAQMIASLF